MKLHAGRIALQVKKWGVVKGKMTGAHGTLIPLTFVTFRSSRAAADALMNQELIAALSRLGVKMGRAPRPTDVKWTHLHMDTKSRYLPLRCRLNGICPPVLHLLPPDYIS